MSDDLFRRLERSFLVRGVAILLPAAVPLTACSGERHIAGSSGSCCEERRWSATAEVAKVYATKDSVEQHGCPTKVTRGDEGPDGAAPDAGEAPPPWGTLDLVEGPGQACAYHRITCCPGGRPLYGAEDAGRAVVASRTRGARWTRRALGPLGTSLAPDERAAIARGWLEDAFAEHASVASFARATLELMAASAPPALLAAHQRAGLQEIRHAQRCFALARAYGDRAIDPGAIAIPLPRGGGLVRLAGDTFVEGCVAETIGALLAVRALEACTVPEARDALRVIRADEAAHAALAWRTLAWAVNEGGDAVVRAVLERAASARRLDLREHAPRMPSALRTHGRLDDADVAEVTREAWVGIIDPLVAKLRRNARGLCLPG